MFSPIIQSGGKYDLKVSASSNNDNLKPGIILASLGIRYKNYCSSMGRTFLISPGKVGVSRLLATDVKLTEVHQKQESYYSILLEARQEALKTLKDGAILRDVYSHVHSFIEAKSPTLGEAFVKNLGFAVRSSRTTWPF